MIAPFIRIHECSSCLCLHLTRLIHGIMPFGVAMMVLGRLRVCAWKLVSSFSSFICLILLARMKYRREMQWGSRNQGLPKLLHFVKLGFLMLIFSSFVVEMELLSVFLRISAVEYFRSRWFLPLLNKFHDAQFVPYGFLNHWTVLTAQSASRNNWTRNCLLHHSSPHSDISLSKFKWNHFPEFPLSFNTLVLFS